MTTHSKKKPTVLRLAKGGLRWGDRSKGTEREKADEAERLRRGERREQARTKMGIVGFREFCEDAQGPDNVNKRRPPDSPEKIFAPRPAGEREFFDSHWNKLKKTDYPVKVDGQFKGRTSQAHLPHDGYDAGIGGEKKPVEQGNSRDKDTGKAPVAKRGYGELRAVKQGSSTVKKSPPIREGVGDVSRKEMKKFRARHDGKNPEQLRSHARKPGMKPWQASELRHMSMKQHLEKDKK